PTQVGHRVSEGTASWSDLNDGAGGLFYKVDDGVDDLVVGEKILAMFVTAVSVCRHQVCSLELKTGVLLGVEKEPGMTNDRPAKGPERFLTYGVGNRLSG